MTLTNATISGVAGYVPDYVLTNDELQGIVNTSDEWISRRTGIKQRHILKDKGLATSYMGIRAVKELLAKTNTNPEDVDLIICATITPDYPTPSAANIIAHGVGAINSFSYDLNAACSGFLYALLAAEQYVATGRCKKVIVVGADKMSAITDYQDRTTCILFGDGAGAVLLEPTGDDDVGLVDSIMKCDGAGQNSLYQKAGGSMHPSSHLTVHNREHYIHQDGRSVFKVAVDKMIDAAKLIMKRNNLSVNDIAFLVPHQANKRIIDAIANNIGIAEDKVMITIQEFGNTTAATIPLCLWRYEKQLAKNDKIILVSFGGGFTWGSMYLKWSYDSEK